MCPSLVAKFSSDVSFSGAKFLGKGDMYFSGAKFSGGHVSFGDFLNEGNLDFTGAKFLGKGGVNFTHVKTP